MSKFGTVPIFFAVCWFGFAVFVYIIRKFVAKSWKGNLLKVGRIIG